MSAGRISGCHDCDGFPTVTKRLLIAVLALVWLPLGLACGRPVGDVSLCANGVLDPGEECDDANHVELDGCGRHCTIDPIRVTRSADCEADVAMTPAGAIAVAWWEGDGDGVSGHVRWRVWGESGLVMQSGEYPAVLRRGCIQLAMREDGDLVIAWGNSDDSIRSLYISAAEVTPLELLGPNIVHDIAFLPDNRYAILWQQERTVCYFSTGIHVLSPRVGLLDEIVLDDGACPSDGSPQLAIGPMGDLLGLYVRTDSETGFAELIAQRVESSGELVAEVTVDSQHIDTLHPPDVPGLSYYNGGVYINLQIQFLPNDQALAVSHTIDAGKEYLGRVWLLEADGATAALETVFRPPGDSEFHPPPPDEWYTAIAGTVAIDDGRFWLAWRDRELQAPLLQQFMSTGNAIGNAIGEPMRARTLPEAKRIANLSIAGAPDGRFTLLWCERPASEGGRLACYLQRFDPDGRAIGSLPWIDEL